VRGVGFLIHHKYELKIVKPLAGPGALQSRSKITKERSKSPIYYGDNDEILI
jgi:hypothetical protein